MEGLTTQTTSVKNWLFDFKISLNDYYLGDVC